MFLSHCWYWTLLHPSKILNLFSNKNEAVFNWKALFMQPIFGRPWASRPVPILTWLSIEGVHHPLIYHYTCQPRQICIMWQQQDLLNQERGAMIEQHRHLGSSSIGRLRFRETDPSKRRSGATGRQLVATVHHHHHHRHHHYHHHHHYQSVVDVVLTTGWWQLIAFLACKNIESLYVSRLFRHLI